MSRAVIDQFGFRTVFIGLIISLILGLTLKAQISSQKIQNLITESTARLDQDFIIDFQSAEVILSKWGLPLPFVQISQIRMSPKKALCQDSQIYIEKLILPLSPLSLLTSKTLVKEISATTIELRVADLQNCLSGNSKLKENASDKSGNIKATVTEPFNTNKDKSKKEVAESLFQVKSAGLLQKIKIDQLKIIYKKYPAQPLNFRQVVVDLSYVDKKMERVAVTAQVHALKDPASDLMFFKGELALVMTDKGVHRVETEAKLRGRLLDGEIQAYTVYNSLEHNVKVDFDLRNVPLKPLMQLNLIESTWFSYPVAFQFHGFGQFQIDGHPLTILKLSDISIAGERTHIKVDEIKVREENSQLKIEPFQAEIKNLDLNKLANINQIKSISQSIDDFGEINGNFKFSNQDSAEFQGDWTGLAFIFSNRGQREVQKIDTFHVAGKLHDENLNFKLDQLQINREAVTGEMLLSANRKNSNVQAEASLSGSFLNEKIWQLLTGVSQKPSLKLNWNFKKSLEERHQLNLHVDQIQTDGLKLTSTDLNMIQSAQNGESISLALMAKSSAVEIDSDSLKIRLLQQIFSPTSYLKEKAYVTEPFILNLKGSDWKSMNYDFETKVNAKSEVKVAALLKGRGDWKEDESASGNLTIQSSGQVFRYEIIKKPNNLFEVQPL